MRNQNTDKINALKAALQAELNRYLKSRTFYLRWTDQELDQRKLHYGYFKNDPDYLYRVCTDEDDKSTIFFTTSHGLEPLTAERAVLILTLHQAVTKICDKAQEDKYAQLHAVFQTAAESNTNLTSKYHKTHLTYKQLRDSGVGMAAAFLRALFSCQSQAQRTIERCQQMITKHQSIFAAPAPQEGEEGQAQQPGARTPTAASAPGPRS